MKNHDTIAVRLAAILTRLNEGETLEVVALAEEFGVTVRTIQRDLNKRLAYLPLEQVEGLYKVDSEVVGYFIRRKILPHQQIVKELEDGGVLVTSTIAFDEEILKLIRYWIPNLVIVSPEVPQQKLEEGLRGYLSAGKGMASINKAI